MIPNLNATFAISIFGMLLLIFIMFLPTLLELKKPQDAGPRIIEDGILQVFLAKQIPIVNLEEKHMFEQPIAKRIIDIINVLPNLEA